MKLFELSKDLGLKTTELIELAQELGFEDKYIGIAKEIAENDELILRAGSVSRVETNRANVESVVENSKVLLVGMLYNAETNTYQVANINIESQKFLDIGGDLSKEFTTVYNARNTFNILLNNSTGIISPNKLENRLWRNK